MRIFIAGATGVIGQMLLPKLVSKGYEVTGMTHNENRVSQIESTGAKAVIADIFNSDAVKRAVEAAKPDVVIHQLTALREWNLSDNAKIREIGTRNLVDAARDAGVSSMIAQSISWAYEAGNSPAKESDDLDIGAPMPRKTTVDSVIALEQIVSEMPKHVILRYGMLYGPGTWYAKGGIMAEKIRRKQVPATEAVTSFLHVEDAANAAILALNWPTGVVNIVDDEPASGKEWLPHYASLIGAPAPDVQPDRKGWERGASNTKARNEYGWEPLFPSWRSGFIENFKD